MYRNFHGNTIKLPRCLWKYSIQICKEIFISYIKLFSKSNAFQRKLWRKLVPVDFPALPPFQDLCVCWRRVGGENCSISDYPSSSSIEPMSHCLRARVTSVTVWNWGMLWFSSLLGGSVIFCKAIFFVWCLQWFFLLFFLLLSSPTSL